MNGPRAQKILATCFHGWQVTMKSTKNEPLEIKYPTVGHADYQASPPLQLLPTMLNKFTYIHIW